MQPKPRETVQELTARIQHDAAACDFASIKDPLYEALRTRFFCSIAYKMVLKEIFKIKAGELTFSRAFEVELQTEDAAKFAKENVYNTQPSTSVYKVWGTRKNHEKPKKITKNPMKKSLQEINVIDLERV